MRVKGIRVENSGPEVEDWCTATDCGSTMVDICMDCYADHNPQELADIIMRPGVQGEGEPVGFFLAEGSPRPDYNDTEYECELCTVRLAD